MRRGMSLAKKVAVLMGGGGGWEPTFLFLDKFTTLDAAPLTSPRTCEPGPGTWTVETDTGNLLNITGGALVHTATATNNPKINATATLTRVAGLGYFASLLRTDNNAQYFQMLAANNFAVYAMRVSSIVSLTTPNAGSAALIEPEAHTYYRAGYVLRSSGAYYIFDGKLVWVSNTSAVDVKPSIADRAGNVGALVDRVSCAVLPGAFASDYGLATFRVAIPTDGEIKAGVADGLTEFTWTPAAGETLNLMVRRTDDDNCWIVRCVQADSKIYLYQKEGGVETEYGATGGIAQTWTAGTPYRIIVQAFIGTINVHVNDTVKIMYTLAAFNQTATGVKVAGFSEGENLIAWARQLSATNIGYINQLFGTPINAALPLATPTYDTSGEAVHPSVKYISAGWNGYKYWMAMTPYPAGDDDIENPSIIVSNDGITWIEPDGITNPISGVPSVGTFYSDPELVLSEDGVTLYCIYRWSNGTDTSKIYIRSSTDGVTWSAATELLTGITTIFVSPSIVWDGTQYVMWLNDSSGGSGAYKIVKRTCATIAGTWSEPSDCTFANKRPYNDLWHISVVKVGATYYMFVGLSAPGGSTKADIFLATSSDGDAWTFDPEIVIPRGETGAWDEDRQHRCFPLTTDGVIFILYYSAKSVANAWHIGRTTFTRA